MKKILFFSLFFIVLVSGKAQEAVLSSEPLGSAVTAAADTVTANTADTVAQTDSIADAGQIAEKEKESAVDTIMPVKKSFIRKANIIFRDRDRLKLENNLFRAEIAELKKDIAKKNKQVKELTDYVNNQTFALSEAKKTAQQATEETASFQNEIEQLNQQLKQSQRGKIYWTVGGVVVGAGIGVVVGMLLK